MYFLGDWYDVMKPHVTKVTSMRWLGINGLLFFTIIFLKHFARVSIDTVNDHSIIISERQKHINTSAIVSYVKKSTLKR